MILLPSPLSSQFKNKLASLFVYVIVTWLFVGCSYNFDDIGTYSMIRSKRSVEFDPATGDVLESVEHGRTDRIGFDIDWNKKTIFFYRNENENYAYYYNTIDRNKDVMICDSLHSCVSYALDDNFELCFATKANFGLFFFCIEDGEITDDFSCLEYVFF
jgi:hypothetical protein